MPEAMVASTIAKLEQKTGYQSRDVRLLAENSQKVRSKVIDLGLDPDDTTGEELYHGLLAKYGNDCKVVDKALSVTPQTGVAERVSKAIDLIGKLTKETNVWALKKSALKNILSDVPAKKTMRALHYRSYESMVKREDSLVLFLMANLLESPTWRKNASSRISKLSSSAYEPRAIRIAEIQTEAKQQPVIVDARAGLVAVDAGALDKSTPVLTIALLIHDSVAKLSKNYDKKRITSMNPILSWWEDAEHLLAWNDGFPVSLNLLDVAHAHLNCLGYEDRTKLNGVKTFWSKLLESYKEKIEDVPNEIADFGETVQSSAKKTFMNPMNEMAFEMEEAEA